MCLLFVCTVILCIPWQQQYVKTYSPSQGVIHVICSNVYYQFYMIIYFFCLITEVNHSSQGQILLPSVWHLHRWVQFWYFLELLSYLIFNNSFCLKLTFSELSEMLTLYINCFYIVLILRISIPFLILAKVALS